MILGPQGCCGGEIQGLHELVTAVGAFGVVLMLGVATSLFYEVLRKRRRLREIVFDNLNAAWDGDQFSVNGHLRGMSAEDIANDLTLYAEDCSGYRESELVPHVKAWFAVMDRKAKYEGWL